MGDVRWLDDREQRGWRALLEMHAGLTTRLGRELAVATGLSIQDYGVLASLTEEPSGRRRLFELAEALGWEKSRTSHHVTRMEARGLVERQRCESDRRGAFVTVTQEGRAAIAAAAPTHVEGVRRHFVDRLTPEQLDALASIGRTVVAGLVDSARHDDA